MTNNRFHPLPPELPPKKHEQRTNYRVNRRGYVYLMHIHETPFYKVGLSTKPDSRVKSVFGAVMPFEVSIIHAIATNNMYWLERDIQWRYEEKHVRGEWYRLTPLDVEDFCAFSVVDYHYDSIPKQLMHKPEIWANCLLAEEAAVRKDLDDFFSSVGI